MVHLFLHKKTLALRFKSQQRRKKTPIALTSTRKDRYFLSTRIVAHWTRHTVSLLNMKGRKVDLTAPYCLCPSQSTYLAYQLYLTGPETLLQWRAVLDDEGPHEKQRKSRGEAEEVGANGVFPSCFKDGQCIHNIRSSPSWFSDEGVSFDWCRNCGWI